MAKNHVPEMVRVHRIEGEDVASLKHVPEDFLVEEIWQPEFSGEGEHLYLFVEKTGQNTPWIAKQLANSFGICEKNVGYSGLKDRQAVTKQWFSLPVPAQKAKIDPIVEGMRILHKARHVSKLRRGSHSGNSFQIRLRDLEADKEQLISRLQAVSDQGFPNYFGLQRFGRSGNNLRAGRQLAKSRKLVGHPKRGIYLSAMRSSLFNQVLAEQIRVGNWPAILDFDSGLDTSLDDESKLAATGPMWGRGRPLFAEIGKDIESEVVKENAELCDLLEHGGLSQERRPLRQYAENLSWVIEDKDLLMQFCLPPGSYATVLIDEIIGVRVGIKK